MEGGSTLELVERYIKASQRKLVDPEKQRICDGVYSSLLTELSLADYIIARSDYCQVVHDKQCLICSPMLTVANRVIQNGFCTLAEAHHMVSPDQKFRADNARNNLLQMPLVCIRVGDPNSGVSYNLLMERHDGVSPVNIAKMLNTMASRSQHKTLDKSFVKLLLNLAGSECARECVCYAVVKS